MEDPPDLFSRWLGETAEVKIVDLNSRNWRSKIFNYLKPPFLEDPKRARGGGPFVQILNIARDKLEARTAVIEPYISTDWNEEYGVMYSRVFQPPPQRASRIHFFSTTPKGGVVTSSDLFEMSKEVRRCYLGYTVIRPLLAFRVGDTVLKSPCYISRSDGKGSQRFHLSHCSATFAVSLLGNKLTVKGMPFIQQETNVAVCAEADLWMVARYLNKMSETIRYRPAEITDLATRPYAHGPARDGLTDAQIFGAFRSMNLKAQPYFPENPEVARDFLYMCVESSIPVIASLPGHVVVVIGHDYKKKMRFRKGLRSMSELVENFYVHDDAAGPYLPMRVGKTVYRGSESSLRGTELLTLNGQVLEMCIVPLPARVHLTLDDILEKIEPWLELINDYISAEMPNVPKKFLWPPWPKRGLIRRTYLRRSNEFKSDLLRGTGPKRNLDVIAQYRCMQMPKYVWVVELADPRDLEGQNPYDRQIRGEMIFDSTANRHAIEDCLLSFHYDSRLYVRGHGERRSLFIVGEGGSPYQPLLRAEGSKSEHPQP
jgi:hypothetical protein